MIRLVSDKHSANEIVLLFVEENDNILEINTE